MTRRGRRLSRRLGLPVLSVRAWLLLLLALLGVVYAGTLLIGDFVGKLGDYAPQYYEPKDFRREEVLEKKPVEQP